MSGPIRILSIDGGGIRGLIPALVLDAIEQELRQPIARSFDLIAGTSTGGILAVGLTTPGANGQPKYTPAALADLYRKEGGRIFSSTFAHKLVSVFSLNGPKYDASGIESVLQQYFGGARLKDSLTEVLVTSYEIDQLRDPFFFSSRMAKQQATYDFPAWQVARATSAAPTYFPPLKLAANPGDDHPYYALVDGGTFANNPALCAYAEARANDGVSDILIVSVGTGQRQDAIPYDSARGWGLLRWARTIIDVVFDGVADTVDYQLKQLLPALATGHVRYFRLQAALDADETNMDDTSADNLDRLQATAQKVVADNHDLIVQLCAELKGGAPVLAGR